MIVGARQHVCGVVCFYWGLVIRALSTLLSSSAARRERDIVRYYRNGGVSTSRLAEALRRRGSGYFIRLFCASPQIFPPLLRHTPSLPPLCGLRRRRSTLSLSLPDLSSSARANLVCAVMIAMSGLAQNLEQFIYFICDCCLLGFLPLSQNKSLFRQGENETFTDVLHFF